MNYVLFLSLFTHLAIHMSCLTSRGSVCSAYANFHERFWRVLKLVHTMQTEMKEHECPYFPERYFAVR
jgi:hypothetical protein